ncbi:MULTISPECIES: carboxylesterase/lipase family protein [unclassified Novosphingobium]|uniref:carboxylesterase/lipase family protein n=1 Tax=unclassified Novosphingobium TaxID=2644732 RepID=UPI001494BADA|nr:MULTISPECIES: carboxylesterase/lipase family protein [unclassified Novosphingobium]MBB3360001.1 para-nitrobenzyl esterase [Novosphingobium sp. BK256]MBB3376360.1 para-nitrobenzyl esterase [Novosphingobium sp. BK280]MBB3380759.1 para-nitrobenzyl esterase [Novosphingobium sp. BK258]MBB3422425.1 para-nitrobenzyl esterase [Novosphingobium sp. BK267]MBB3451110.1 para-nitrobenzyl esterase [Novosphingobium sp. BK352]
MTCSVSRRSLLGATAALATCLASRSFTSPAFAGDFGAATPIVKTTNGPVRGRYELSGTLAFKGLRYAAPPVGALRFRPPQPLQPWTDVADAGRFGASAIQAHGQRDAPFDETQSEDCLFLNVWTQGLDQPKPVMVWLHGGAFSSGAGTRPTYWGDHFARDGVVLVSVNHRLNVFGFAQLPDSWGPDYRSSGLAGLLDIVAALRWVRDNIAQFGGDPSNVTLFGESGGGAKVSLLMGMPDAKGLFHKAAIQSGADLDATPRAYATALGGALLDKLGVKPGDVQGLAAVPTQTIFDSQQAAVDAVAKLAPTGFLTGDFTPSIDGKALPRGPFTPDASPLCADIPLIIGTNKDEGTMFALGDKSLATATDADLEAAIAKLLPRKTGEVVAALREAYPGYSPGDLITAFNGNRMFWTNSILLAERKVRQGSPVWMYRMDWETPVFGGRLKAGHAVELSFVFGTHDNIRDFVGPGPGPDRMAAQMHPAWVAFAKTGNPQHPGIPSWPAYNLAQRQTMIFNLQSRVASDPHAALRRLLIAG